MLVLISELSGQSLLPGKPVLKDVLHGFDKRVDLLEGSVDVRRYPQSVVAQVGLLGIVVADGGDHDAVLIPKVRNELVRSEERRVGKRRIRGGGCIDTT